MYFKLVPPVPLSRGVVCPRKPAEFNYNIVQVATAWVGHNQNQSTFLGTSRQLIHPTAVSDWSPFPVKSSQAELSSMVLNLTTPTASVPSTHRKRTAPLPAKPSQRIPRCCAYQRPESQAEEVCNVTRRHALLAASIGSFANPWRPPPAHAGLVQFPSNDLHNRYFLVSQQQLHPIFSVENCGCSTSSRRMVRSRSINPAGLNGCSISNFSSRSRSCNTSSTGTSAALSKQQQYFHCQQNNSDSRSRSRNTSSTSATLLNQKQCLNCRYQQNNKDNSTSCNRYTKA